MAADCFKIKKHFKSNSKIFMDQNYKCSLGTSKSSLNILPQPIESPPPKPPRRRYSDQISISSLGTYSVDKKHDEVLQRHNSKSIVTNRNVKPTYLSLPANLSLNPLTEHNSPAVLLPYSISFAEQLKYFKENESDDIQPKLYFEKPHSLVSGTEQTFSYINTFGNKEKARRASQGSFIDNSVSSYEFGNLTSYSVDKLIQNSFCSDVFLVSNCDSQHMNTSYIKCHRRHHSDSAIKYFNMPNPNSLLKSDHQIYWDDSISSKAFKKCDSLATCSCCKKSYFTLQEIQVLKEINEKLWQHLCSVQNCLENIRRKSYEESTDVSISGLLSGVYYAQKARDNAMEERLKIAVEERDSALLELENVISIFTKSLDTTDALEFGGKELDEGLKEILHEIGCSPNPSRVLKYQRKLLAHICTLKKSKQEILSSEVKLAAVERDKTLEKVTKLEEEIKALKLCFDLWNLDNKHWELTLFDVVHQLVHQRDGILSKVENNIDAGNVLCRTQAGKLDFLEQHTIPNFVPKFCDTHSSHPLVNDSKQSKFFGKPDEINKLQEEILFLNSQLEDERIKREQAEGKCVRLEGLIHTLRKKLNGQNIGIPV